MVILDFGIRKSIYILGEDEWQGTCTRGFSESHSSFEAVRMCPRAV